MMYKVNLVEVKTSSSGKEYKKATVVDEQGAEHQVSVWPDFASYQEVQAGRAVEGTITQKGQYKNLTSGMGPKPAWAEKALDKKNESIAKFQASKEDSIKMASAARDATLIVTTFYLELANFTDKEEIIKEKWNQWRSWFLGAGDQPF